MNFLKATLTHSATTCLLVSTCTVFNMASFTIEPDLKATLLEMSEEDLMAFVELQEDSFSGAPVELTIFMHFLIYHRKGGLENIEHARHLSEAWVASTAADDPDRTRREEISNMLSAVLTQETLESEEPRNGDPGGLEELLKNRGNLDKLIPKFEEIVTDPGHPKYSEAWQCLPVSYMNLFQHTADIRDLDRSIATLPKLVNALSEKDPAATAHAFMLLSFSLAELDKQRSRVSELSEASEAADMSVALATDMNKSLRARHSFRLGTLLNRKSIIKKTTEDMLRVIDLFEEHLELVFNRAPLYVLADSQKRLWVTTQAKADLNRAIIDLYERIIRQIPDDNRDAELLRYLSLMYSQKCEDGGLPEDMNRSVELMEMAVNIALDEPMSDNEPMLNKKSSRRELAKILQQRYDMMNSSEDRDSAIDIYWSEVRKHPNHESCGRLLHDLGCLLYDRYEQSNNLKDLEDGIAFKRECVEKLGENSFGTDQIQWAREATHLAQMLRDRFDRQGEIEDLNESISLLENVFSAELHWPEGKIIILHLVKHLGERYELTNSKQDLDRAIEISEKAVEAYSTEDLKKRAGSINNLAMLRSVRYTAFGQREDLERALEEAEIAVGLMSVEKMPLEGIMCCLPSILMLKYENDGFEKDIERAIAIGIESGRAFLAEDPSRRHPLFASNLVQALVRRYDLKGFTDDLDHAVAAAREAASTLRPTDSARMNALINLGFVLLKRSGLLGQRASEDLDVAIEAAEEALKLAKNGSPKIACSMNLANYLSLHFRICNDKDDLHRAMQILKNISSVMPDGFQYRHLFLANLSNIYYEMYEATNDKQYISDMVENSHLALSCTPVNTRSWTQVCLNAGRHRFSRYNDSGNEEDLNEAVKLFSSGWNNVHGSPSFRIACSQKAAFALARKSDWEGAYFMFEKGIKLLPNVSPRSLKNQDKQFALGNLVSIASEAVATSLIVGKRPSKALQMLELGRGIIAGSLLEMRTDISELRQKHTRLADRFLFLRDHLDQSSITVHHALSSAEKFELISNADRREDMGRKFDTILDEIRALEGFDSFLLPPKEADIMGAAKKGPIVVINISGFRCDAFLIEKNRIRVIKLPVEGDEIVCWLEKARTGGITHDILESLWHQVTQPILDALGFVNTPHNDIWPHVWWIPTGSLSHLPLHAAGKHNRGSSDTVLDRVISSYAPSVKALIYAQRIKETNQKISKNVDFDNHLGVIGNTVVISMEKTPGLGDRSDLPFASKEVDKLKKVFPLLGMSTTEPFRTHDDVLEKMRTCDIFHFAGHGKSDPLNPSASCLLLNDWIVNPLTVEDLRNSRFQDSPPFLGYLSACSTSANNVDKLNEESIHLVSAFQLAGFRHVVGTLWEVSDSACVDVAKIFYDNIRKEKMTDESISRGLHHAVRALRDRKVKELEWEAEPSNVEILANVRSGSRSTFDGKLATIDHETATKNQINNGEAEVTSDADRDDRTVTQVYILGKTSVLKPQAHPRLWAPYIHYGV